MRAGEPGTIWVESIVSGRTRKGLVQITWGELRCQLSVEEARAHALLILETAEAARSDELIFSLMTDKVGLSPDSAVRVLKDLREMRDRADAEEKPS